MTGTRGAPAANVIDPEATVESLRGVKVRLLVYMATGAVLTPLLCILPFAGRSSVAGRVVMIVYAVGAVALAAAAVRSMRRESRRLTDYDSEIHGVCSGCGYDLRATPGRCPECGRAVGANADEPGATTTPPASADPAAPE